MEEKKEEKNPPSPSSLLISFRHSIPSVWGKGQDNQGTSKGTFFSPLQLLTIRFTDWASFLKGIRTNFFDPIFLGRDSQSNLYIYPTTGLQEALPLLKGRTSHFHSRCTEWHAALSLWSWERSRTWWHNTRQLTQLPMQSLAREESDRRLLPTLSFEPNVQCSHIQSRSTVSLLKQTPPGGHVDGGKVRLKKAIQGCFKEPRQVVQDVSP